jgi:cell wall-associated NlpC family hydrolase
VAVSGDSRGSEGASSCGGILSKAAGISISPYGEEQWAEGHKRPKGEAKPGDILVWSENGSGQVTHVGICARDTKYTWHASHYFDEVVKTRRRYIDGYLGAVVYYHRDSQSY